MWKTYFVAILFEVFLDEVSVKENLHFLLLGKAGTLEKTCIVPISAEARVFYQRDQDNKPVLEVFLMHH